MMTFEWQSEPNVVTEFNLLVTIKNAHMLKENLQL